MAWMNVDKVSTKKLWKQKDKKSVCLKGIKYMYLVCCMNELNESNDRVLNLFGVTCNIPSISNVIWGMFPATFIDKKPLLGLSNFKNYLSQDHGLNLKDLC